MSKPFIATIVITLPTSIKTEGGASDYISELLSDLGDEPSETDGAWSYPGVSGKFMYPSNNNNYEEKNER